MKFLPASFFILLLTNLSHFRCTGVAEVVVDSTLTDYDHEKVPYRFYEPDAVHKLHYDLEEISGLTYYEDGILGAVQDESGWLFLLETSSGEITDKIKFAKSGDYECIERVNDKVYIMQSDGDLYSFPIPLINQEEVKKVTTGFSIKNDVEGMGMLNGQLLIITKASGDIEGNKLKGKGGYLYDIVEGQLAPEETIQLKKVDIDDFLSSKSHFSKLKDFDPSGVAVHPVSNDIYIISADRAIVVLSATLEIKEVIKLTSTIYKQPEGICFSPEGKLYIASEGAGSRGRLVELSYLIH